MKLEQQLFKEITFICKKNCIYFLHIKLNKNVKNIYNEYKYFKSKHKNHTSNKNVNKIINLINTNVKHYYLWNNNTYNGKEKSILLLFV